MTASLDLVTARARAESLMTSTCTIREASTGNTTDPDTGEVTPILGATVYSGPCRIRSVGNGSSVRAGGAEMFDFDYLVDIPFSAAGTRAGQIVEVDSSPDPDLEGLEVEIQKPYRGDQIVRRQLACTEIA